VALGLLVDDALRLWASIPDEALTAAVEAGIIEAGAWPATAGLVARCFERAKAPTLPSLGYIDSSSKVLQGARDWDAWWNGLTDEEREAERQHHREFWRGLGRKVGAT
jgi:hypothetical protein